MRLWDGRSAKRILCRKSGSIPQRELHWSASMDSNPITGSALPAKITPQLLQEKKTQGRLIAALTAYDYATARLVDEAGVDMILVGDSLAMVVLGYDNTLPITVDEMLYHTRAVRRAVNRALLVADMPFGSYHAGRDAALTNAIRFIKEAGAEAVKIEGGASRAKLISRITSAEVPVIGHIGLTPQSVRKMGGYRVQAKSIDAFRRLMEDAIAVEAAGAFALVLEGVPREVARHITEAVKIPVIGIGAGPDCDGQILVLHDLIHLTSAAPPKFVRRYADAAALISGAVTSYVKDVTTRQFPNEEESYHLPEKVRTAIDDQLLQSFAASENQSPSEGRARC